MHRVPTVAVALGTLFAMGMLVGKARADGVPAYLDQTGWHMAAEEAQHAVVWWHEGRETLLLRVHLAPGTVPAEARRLVWVTPVPAAAPDVHVDVLPSFPEFYGAEPVGRLRSQISGALWAMAATQIYPLPGLMLLLVSRAAQLPAPEATVFQRVRGHGIELELISAPTIVSLVGHLRSWNIALPRRALTALHPYVGGEGAFVVFRIADLAAYRSAVQDGDGPWKSLGVKVAFPSSTGFFPLMASSTLPGDQLAVVVTAVGFVHPVGKTPPGLATSHYVGGLSKTEGSFDALDQALARHGGRYTRMVLRAPRRELTADLRFSPGASPLTEWAAAFSSDAWPSWTGWTAMLLVFWMLSVLAALITRGLWPQASRPSRFGACAIGLSNIGTLAGLIIAARLATYRRGIRPKKAWAFALATSATFCGLLLALALAIFLLL